ncbi:MAG: hypothetical protein LBL95_09455 [Deltaproteobacteria bacterium]|jgi:hypothetical protein|nr:hypothetical protein [Deltaproteobacteria bacterium]
MTGDFDAELFERIIREERAPERQGLPLTIFEMDAIHVRYHLEMSHRQMLAEGLVNEDGSLTEKGMLADEEEPEP